MTRMILCIYQQSSNMGYYKYKEVKEARSLTPPPPQKNPKQQHYTLRIIFVKWPGVHT